MPQSLRAGAVSLLLTLGGWAAMPATAAVVACSRAATPPAVVRSPPPPGARADRAPAGPAPTPLAPMATETASAAPLPPAPAPTSTVATTRSDPSWVSCHRASRARGQDLASAVAAVAGGCAASTQMKLVGTTLTGRQAAEDTPQTFPFEAKGGHCYRVYARAAETIENLDLVVKDSASIAVGQDSTSDPNPVVLEDGEVCFRQDDKASVVVSVGTGKGRYALQIWGD
jgi:hypothetical protein